MRHEGLQGSYFGCCDLTKSIIESGKHLVDFGKLITLGGGVKNEVIHKLCDICLLLWHLLQRRQGIEESFIDGDRCTFFPFLKYSAFEYQLWGQPLA